MSKRDTILLLDDILQSAQKIKRYTENLDFDSFISDDKTIDAVVRNRIVHDYFGIDYSYVSRKIHRINEFFRLDELITWLDTIIDENKAT